MSVKKTKSKDFDRNLDSAVMNKQIQKNLYASSEILKDTSNSIAPVQSGQLRSNTKTINSGMKSEVTWEQPYAAIRYQKNNKNPQTTHWVQKGYKKKRQVLNNRMTEGVVI